MTDIAIRVENLSKRYRIGAREKRANTLRERLANLAASPFDYLRRTLRGPTEEEIIWALKDVSFEVQRGEVVGIIGRNGAGKSTLLKILSRITEPTEGRAEINGRVGSLLEVGTGFHPELTGRENIYLNGAILGMKRAEIERKFDEIVDFSGVEKFIDTPVKRYSSGMYVRLAFAVAAHLDPEILLIDEVLAVGDATFQKRCLDKMGELGRGGRTVLFVSHQLAMVNELCDRAMLLHEGSVVQNGATASVIDGYLEMAVGRKGARSSVEFEENVDLPAQILRARVHKASGQPADTIDAFDQLAMTIDYVIRQKIEGAVVLISVKRNGQKLFTSFDADSDPDLLRVRNRGYYTTTLRLPCPLKAGRYTVSVNVGRPNVGGIDVHPDAVGFDVEEISFDTSMRSYSSKRGGVIAVKLDWNTQRRMLSSKLGS